MDSRISSKAELSKKWFQQKRNLKVGDLVLVVEAERGDLPLERIIEVCPSSDALIRVVKMKLWKTIYRRPVHRLCPLEIDNEAE